MTTFVGNGNDDQDAVLWAAWCAGDQDAAARLFLRYYDRVTALARSQLGWRLRGVESSADLAQSVFHSLFSNYRQRHTTLEGLTSLWPLLAAMTFNKVRNRHKFYSRQKRDRGREVECSAETPVELGNSPDDQAMLQETFAQLVASFDSPRRQRIVQLLLEGHSATDIARAVGTSKRTVYKTREAAVGMLQMALRDA
jgi:RNA polymerase sigma factor (sigma-70 family)